MEVPVLHPGDIVHLAFPIEEIEDPAAHFRRSNELYEQMKQFYGPLGVSIGAWTSSTKLDRPVIIAIFRKG